MKPWDCKHCAKQDECHLTGTIGTEVCVEFDPIPPNRDAIAEVMRGFCSLHETDAQYLDRQVRRYGFVKMARPGNYFSEE